MKKSAKRLLSLAICLVMVLSMLPMAVFAESTTMVYCQTPASWTTCKVYWWGSAAGNPAWPGNTMTRNEDGVWYFEVPSDATGLVFNDGKGTQTADLQVPTDDKVMFVVGNNAWAIYGKVDVETFDYYVAGESTLCGDHWLANSPANGMTDEDGDGVYTITYKNVAAGSYQLKVTDGSWGSSWGANGGGSNYVLTLTENVAYVEIRFDSVTHQITTKTDKEGAVAPLEVKYYVAGSMNDWAAAAEGYQLTDNGNGLYSLKLDLAAGKYEMKITDGTWDNAWGDGDDNYRFNLTKACKVTIVFDADGSTITATGEFLGEEEKKPLDIQSIHAVGSFGLTGSEWGVAANAMTNDNGVYTITFENVAAGRYEFKFAANGAWELNWAYGAEMESGEVYNAWLNGSNNILVIEEDRATVTLTLDLTKMDPFTGEGAKCSAVVENQEFQVVGEGTATFKTSDAAFDGEIVAFTPETNGSVTVEILSSTPGYYVDVYSGGEWLVDFSGLGADTVTFDVKGGSFIEVLLCTYEIKSEFIKEAAPGTISYRVTYVSDGSQSGDDAPELPDDVFNEPGSTMNNPKVITGTDWTFIAGNTSVWYLYDNYQDMVENGVYSMMLHIHSGVDYSVFYRGTDVPVDADGFVNYEMLDQTFTGQYLFCVTNNTAEEAFFSVRVAERPAYVNNGGELKIGDNDIVLDSSAVYTLYEFTPSKTGVYRITAAEGLVGDWGTSFNPQDNTENKTSVLEWTCTAVGQSVMIGFTGADVTVATVVKIGNYTPEVEIPYTYYENTYDFSYVMPTNPVVVDIDLLDGKTHQAVLGADGFYHYGTGCGPLMVADLSTAEINLEDAYTNGGLRVWLMDKNGETIAKIDYNEALHVYYQAGLVPVTEELATMLSQLGENKMWWRANGFIFGEDVPEDTSIAWMQLCAYLAGSNEHHFAGGTCTYCGEADPNYVKNYYLFGFINGANYGCDEDHENMGEYMFVDGKLVTSFQQDSYVAVKTEGNGAWYMTNGWLGDATVATLYDTAKVTVDANKLFVPDHVELTFTLVENKDGTLTLSYVITHCDHNYIGNVTTAPSCEKGGVKTFTCKHCGDSYTEAISAVGHNYTASVTKAPGCETKGVKTFTCGNCGDSYTKSIPAIGHSYTASVTKAPGCESKGVKTFTCGNCGDSYTEAIPAIGHSYTASVTTAPSCEKEGVKTFTCGNCGDSYTEAIPAISHSYTFTVTTAPSCEKEGVKTFTCGNCGGSYTEAIPAIGHSYTASVTTAPGCETEGVKTFTCGNCSGSYTEAIPANGHSYENGKCTACGDMEEEIVKNYYLFGYINGANYACEEDYENMGQYKFEEGKLVATFTQDSYVAVKTEGNGAWYMTNGWLGEATQAVLYNTDTEGMEFNKLFIPANVEITFTLTENEDGTLTLSYEKAVSYQVSFVVPEGVASVDSMISGADGIALPKAGNPEGKYSYTFLGWTDGKLTATTAAPTIYTGTYIPTGDTTLYALYTYTQGGSSESGWKLVTDAAELAAGDSLVIANGSNGVVAAEITKQYFTIAEATFSQDGASLVLPEGAVVLTLGQSDGFWTLSNASGQLLGATAVKKIAWDSGTAGWSIAIDENGDATITNSNESFGRFLYNVTSTRFTTYTSNVTASMQLPQLYKLTGSAGSTYYTTEIEKVPQGVQVSGTVTSSSLVQGDVTVELWLEGAETAAYTVVAQGGVYTFENVLPGSYTLTVSKANHVTRSYEITVEKEAVTMAVKICLLGDLTGDGLINIGDAAKLYAHVKGTALLDDEYVQACANANGGSLNIGDVANIYAHVKGTKPLF